MTYLEKLQDPRWQKIRLRVLDRAGFKCECCGDIKTSLQVHHLIYCGEPWDSKMEHLECLCRPCHEWRERFNEFWGGRSLHPTGFCVHFKYFFDSHFDGTEPIPKSLSILTMVLEKVGRERKKFENGEVDKNFVPIQNGEPPSVPEMLK